ncbi:MAG: ACT domain-containing protein [Firmicutes bacterium]|nr:ACT domain-containing protein [Bacillota bacterium]
MENQVLITAYGMDQTGIVKRMSQVLLDMGCNIQDSAMKQMRGNFVIMMAVSLPERDEALAELDVAFEPVRTEMGLDIEIKHFSHAHSKPVKAEDRTCILTVSGGDKPGIVHAVSSLLAEMEINIDDISTKLIEYESGDNLYVSIMEITLPPELSYTRLKENLLALSGRLNVNIEIEVVEDDAL